MINRYKATAGMDDIVMVSFTVRAKDVFEAGHKAKARVRSQFPAWDLQSVRKIV